MDTLTIVFRELQVRKVDSNGYLRQRTYHNVTDLTIREGVYIITYQTDDGFCRDTFPIDLVASTESRPEESNV